MYIEADILYSYLKPTDWLKACSAKILNKYNNLKTSAITITEIELVSKRDFGEQFSNSVLERVKDIKNLKFLALDISILKKAVEYRKKYGLNIFDSIHAASAFKIKKEIISTDNIYDIIEGMKRKDPRQIE